MAGLGGAERARYVQGMFARIARRYDLMNRLMTAGQDVRWRREAIHRAQLPPGGRLLDLGAGTGDLAREARRQQPAGLPVATDFTLEMMRVGRAYPGSAAFSWVAADALCLPFVSDSFDAVVSGFLMRNVIDLPRALREQARLLRPAGRVVILDTTPPRPGLFFSLVQFHLKYTIPALGRLVTGDADAYTYLPDSTQAFLTAEQLAQEMSRAGFQEIGFRRLMFGAIAIHWGQKPG
jgi:demethylmenaquinone methyltransferase/2-methoxy-6-polyprenyl-1,4-benzoquinol methylase